MNKTELFRQTGENTRSVAARVSDEDFRIETQDTGPVAEKIWGDADYEYWTVVPREAWGDLLVALTKEFFAGDPDATDKLRELCMKYNVQHQWQQWR